MIIVMFCKQYDDYCAYLVIMIYLMNNAYLMKIIIIIMISMCIPYDNDCYDYDAHTLYKLL